MKSTLFLAAIFVSVCGCSQLFAGTIDIQFTGMNLVYDGSTIYDAGGLPGGVGDPADADALASVTFFVDGLPVGTLTSDVWFDTRIAGVSGIPVNGGPVATPGQGDSFGFDLILENSVPGWGLALNLDIVTIFYSGGQIFIAGGGSVSSVRSASELPFQLNLDTNQLITVSFSSTNITNVTHNGVHLTGFSAAGSGNIHGTGGVVPEPSVIALAGVASLFAMAGVRRRRR